MAQFTAKKIDITKINGGEQVASGSGVTPELLNAPINSALYTEKAIEVLTTQVDMSEIEGTGTPNVEFRTVTNGQETYRYLKFKNLKGERGEQGRQGADGKEGRGIKKVSQSGSDLVIEYDDGTTQTMVGAIEALTELPIVSATDTGKILVVNQDGKWSVGDAPQSGGKNIQSIVIEGTSFIVTYIDGSVETVEIDTQNTVVAVPEDVAGGNIADVQVNGTSVVADGVANIPEASTTQAGVMTTGDQTFAGRKHFENGSGIGSVKFWGGILYLGANNTGNHFEFAEQLTSRRRIDLVLGTNGTLGIEMGEYGYDKQKIKYNDKFLKTYIVSTLPDHSGTLMSAATLWTTGISGSATLPSGGGLFEIKTTYQNTLYHFVVYWDGVSSTTSEISITDIQEVGEAIFVGINPTGRIDLYLLNLAGQGGADLSQDISYRKIGIV